jgi:LCP family protein required for cell wall assembly
MRFPTAAAVVAGLLVAIAIGAFAFTNAGNSGALSTNAVSENPVSVAVGKIEETIVPAPEQVFGTDRIRVLVIGLDYDYDRLDQETSKSARSDIIMALSLDFKNHRLNELSIPRDMVATMPDGRRAKINQAESDGGIEESKSVIAGWLGIPPFDRYVVMRIDTSKDLINALGGIDVDVKNSDALRQTGKNGPIDYDDSWGHLHVHLKPGLQHLDGEHAVGYARFRHDWCSDPCRIMRQQQIVRAIVQKLERDRLNTLTHAQQLLGVIRKDIQTDFTLQEELSSAVAFSHVGVRGIHTAQVPFTGDVVLPGYGDSIVPDEAAKQKLVAETFGDLSQNVAATRTPLPAGKVHLHVMNGTTIPGLAARVADSLRRQGFDVSDIGNAPTNDFETTTIQSGPTGAEFSDRVRKALGGSPSMVPSAESADPSDVTIVLGRDTANAKP